MNRKLRITLFLMGAFCPFLFSIAGSDHWTVDRQIDWVETRQSAENIDIIGGQVKSRTTTSKFSSVVKRFPEKRRAGTLTFKQTVVWDNWREIEKVGAPEMDDAPVFIPVKKGDYYLLARYRPQTIGPKKWVGGVDVSDKRDPSELGYHAWHSSDMKNWTRYGPVSGYRERWVTTAEYVDGAFYIYYDHPNDEDPHLIIDRDLRDGKMGEDRGMAFADPSHGSDCAIFRDDADGMFHLIYENWDPINAKTHAWDSPLAGHVVSADGISGFRFSNNAVDHRTKPTGKMSEYVHGTTQDIYPYEIHEPEQNAYGDWTAIKIGGQYYLFCDYDPVGQGIRVGRFTSDRLDSEFKFVGELGAGHPDPTIGFAEGKFYLIRQRAETDFVSPGPWVGGVEARVGVDTSNNGKIDRWTDWHEVIESYEQKAGFVRVVETAPAQMDLSALAEGYGFAFEYRTRLETDQAVNVVMEQVELSFR